jgi:streptogramin lyase
MSDFITGLRGDLVDAADRHRQRGRRRTALLPRVWRPALAAATVLVGAVAVLYAARALSPSPPAVRPEVVKVVSIGGQPQDAVLAEGSLWVSDFEGRVVRVDPASGRVTARIEVPGNPAGIAAGDGAIWVASPDLSPDGDGMLARIDPRSNRVVERVQVGAYVEAIAVGAGGVWLIDQHRPGLDRIDPATGERTARVPFARAGAMVVGDDTTLWALGDEGTVVTVDGRSLSVDRLRGVVASGYASAEDMMAADSDGAWVVARGENKVLRIEAGRVVSQVPVPEAMGPIGLGDGAVWVASGNPDALRSSYRLSHIDAEADAVTGTLDLERRLPKAVVPAGDGVWVIASDGTASLVRPG